jgi:glutamate dehydrogenase (NAD(P)+)
MELLEYTDPVNGCRGYLVYDGRDCRLAAGGCRVQPGLTAATLASLAARMTLKQRVLGLNVDGAKCGLDYDPAAPDAGDVLRRFLTFLRTELAHRFSMGCDMGTRFDHLESLARSVGIPSIKYAVRTAQELTDDDFARRMRVLDTRVGARTVGQRRAGHALAHAALAAARSCGHPAAGLHVGLQGFGNLGRAAAETLVEHGAHVIALADEHGCVVDPRGLDVPRMLTIDHRRPVPNLLGRGLRLPSDALFDLPLDVLVLAAAEDAMTPQQAAVLPIPVVVVGANCGLSACAEQILTDRGVMVVPDFVGGCGGSGSMEALFGPASAPEPTEVLAHLGTLVTELVSDMLSGARDRGVPPTQVARDIAAAAVVSPDRRPYGFSPYSGRGGQPSGRRGAPARANPRGGTP